MANEGPAFGLRGHQGKEQEQNGKDKATRLWTHSPLYLFTLGAVSPVNGLRRGHAGESLQRRCERIRGLSGAGGGGSGRRTAAVYGGRASRRDRPGEPRPCPFGVAQQRV